MNKQQIAAANAQYERRQQKEQERCALWERIFARHEIIRAKANGSAAPDERANAPFHQLHRVRVGARIMIANGDGRLIADVLNGRRQHATQAIDAREAA